MKVAIVGAGVTACLLANNLKNVGCELTVFEKSRGCGGRASSKRTDWGQVDLGATIVPAKKAAFGQFMQTLCKQKLASQWPQKIYSVEQKTDVHGAIQPYISDRQFYIFNHKMNAACKVWLEDVKLCTNSLVTQIRQLENHSWQVKINDIWLDEFFDKIVITAPWPQTQQIIENSALPNALATHSQAWMSCWSVAIKVEQKVDSPIDLLYLKGMPIQTLVRDSAKPYRPPSKSERPEDDSEVWVAQLTNELSASLSKEGKTQAIELANATFSDIFALPRHKISQNIAHYWRYARLASGQTPIGVISQSNIGFYAGGDWSFGASIEAAYQAAIALEQSILTA